jgi:pimeloyl-ACP methyl ester carboxylesterase
MDLFRIILLLCTSVAASRRFRDEKFLFGCFFTESRCPNENVTFHFYTRELQDSPLEINLHQLNSAIFLPNRPLIIIIHGYTGHRDDHPNPQLREAFFKRDNFNIISVDYMNLAPSPCYIHAVENLQTVANCTANLIDFLVDQELFTLDDIHVIGFSLGAQTAGMIANFLTKNRKLKRITGLDPAKPLFITATVDRRLDANDAEFVE